MIENEYWTDIVPDLQAMREIFGLPPFSRLALEIWELSFVGYHPSDTRTAIRLLACSSERCPVPFEVKHKIKFLLDVYGETAPLHHAAPASVQ